MDESDDDAEQFQCATVCPARGGGRVIILKDKVDDLFQIGDRLLARLVNLMELWANGQRLHEKQFKKVRDVGGGSSRSIFEFKSGDARLYGFICNLAGLKTFVVADVDPSKKQQKAKVRILDRCARRILDFEKSFRKSL